MNKKNLDQALAALSNALTGEQPESILDNPMLFIEKIPKRSLSGDHIHGGKILKFSSSGITDLARNEQLVITDDEVSVTTLRAGAIKGSLAVEDEVSAKVVRADILEVKEIRAEIKTDNSQSLSFSDKISGKGLLWTGKGPTKQFVFRADPDKLFSSETIDLAKGKSISINGVDALTETALGSSIKKSNLNEVGTLKGLLVDGSVNVSDWFHINADSQRLSIGTIDAKSTFTVSSDGIEVIIGSKDSNRAVVGTYASQDIDIVTDNTARISIAAGGNITLGNKNTPPIQVSVFGTMGINVNSPDNRATLHVNGPLKFNNSLHLSGSEAPTSGAYATGDIVWNSEPDQRKYVGWVCIRSGAPGIWAPFGEIR